MHRPQSRGTGVETNAVVVDVDPAVARSVIAPLYDGKMLTTGETFLAHADGIVEIVRELRDDADLLAAAYLFGAHDVLREPEEWLRSRFGPSVAQLVNDLRILMRLSERTRPRDGSADSGQAEALRKMLLAMVNDLRVVLLRLASRLQTLRYFVAEERADVVPFARETLELFAPLANRLGIWQMKWELEDLSFRILEPQVFQRVAQWVEERREERESFIAQAMSDLRTMLVDAGIDGEVSGRPKHIYSIWRKMQTKHLAFEQLYDVRALRVIVDSEQDCYQILSLVQARWQTVASEFDDYIAKPKPNGYQSLHTVVLDAGGKPLEIQIRTRRMHESAELGLAAHWRYKEGDHGPREKSSDAERVAWLRQLLAWRQDVDRPSERQRSADDRIYLLTPQGKVVELPAGSTPIDFAYHVHTDLGHRCRGAKVNGVMVPLNTRLATGQTIEILAAKTGGPSRDWLNPELGFLASQRSKAKVRQWFNALELAQTIATGREMLDKELQRLGKTAVKLDDLAHRLGFASVDELCAAVPKEEFNLRSIEQALGTVAAPEPPPARLPLPATKPHETPAGKGRVLVVGVDSLLTSLARCCRPVPPDEIVGFVTRGKGVSIHRAHCANAQALAKKEPERVIEVAWGGERDGHYPVEIFVLAQDRQGLLRDITEVLAREKMNVVGVNTASSRGEAHMSFTIEVTDAPALRRALGQVGEIKGVLSARRR